MGYVLVKYLHFLAILALFAALVSQHLLIRDRIDGALMRRLAVLDRIYGIGLIVALVAGLVLVFAVGKPAVFYARNAVFHLKFGVFLVVFLLWLTQLRFFLQHRGLGETQEVDLPRRVPILMRIQLTLLLLMPLMGTLMALGYGAFD